MQGHNVKRIFIASNSRLVLLSQKPSTTCLELQASVISTRLRNTTANDIPIEKANIFLWTDSKIVLSYLNSNDANFGVYIAHRINKDRKSTNPDNWRYDETKPNPVDRTTLYQDFLYLSLFYIWTVVSSGRPML